MQNVGPDLHWGRDGVEIGAVLSGDESGPDHYIPELSPSLYFGVALFILWCIALACSGATSGRRTEPRRRPTNHWQQPTRPDIHALSKQSANGDCR
jgi:hypothetical protein